MRGPELVLQWRGQPIVDGSFDSLALTLVEKHLGHRECPEHQNDHRHDHQPEEEASLGLLGFLSDRAAVRPDETLPFFLLLSVMVRRAVQGTRGSSSGPPLHGGNSFS